MDNVKEVTSPSTTKNDLKSKDYVKREEGKKEKNSGKKFREEFERVNRERTKKDGNWFEENYDATNKDNETATQQYTDSNISTSVAVRNEFFSRIRVNTEIKVIQDENKSKSQKKLELKRNSGEAR